ncbi:Protein NRT1/ PTR FAMILY 5.6 [Linum perenne]
MEVADQRVLMKAVDKDDKWVHDSSVDHKSRIPLRDATGAWKASLFIILIEFSERLSYFGIATSLIIYLTKVIHQDIKTAARSVNYWSGVTTLMPLVGGFVADSYLGRYYTVLVSSVIYLMGLALLTLSWFVPSLKPCGGGAAAAVCHEPSKVHEVTFFMAIYLISLGTGGHKPALESFGADQFDDDHPEERRKKMSYFNWWNFGLCCGLLLGVTVIVYIQDHVSWGAADVILAVVMSLSLAIFIIGRPFYRYRVPTGSPLTPMLQVIVAAVRKRKLAHLSNPADLYEVKVPQTRPLCHTEKIRFLDKAAIVENRGASNSAADAEKQSPWRLSTVTRVEELKLLLNIFPIWLSTITFGLTVAQGSTFFIKQCTVLDRQIGNGFQIPPASIFSLAAVGMIFSVTLYEKVLVSVLRRATGNERGIKILQRIGIGMMFSIATMTVAALVERKRLAFARENPSKGSLSMSVFWLAPQFLILGFGDGFTLVGLQEYFYEQVPDSMRSLGIAFYLSVIGAGNFVSSVLITAVDRITEKSNGGKSWFGKDLNSSRLDNFYWLLAGISAANLVVYVVLARRYEYKNVKKSAVAVADCEDEHDWP